MSFLSLNFWILIAISMLAYSILGLKLRQFLLLAISLLFYSSINAQFLIPLFIILLSDYSFALLISRFKEQKFRKTFLIIALAVNIGMLFYYKFSFSTIEALKNLFGVQYTFLAPLMPIGISFYTFQSISYLIDVYDTKIRAEVNFFKYALYVTFFPQLVLGPIEKAHDLIPQLNRLRLPTQQELSQAVHYIIIGLLKKVLFANRLELVLMQNVPTEESSIFKIFIFCNFVLMRLYLDFSAYSEIAKGLALLFGVHIQRNFRPYIFTKSPQDFWDRWHISLKNWISTYVYKKLYGEGTSKIKKNLSLLIAFIIGGIWHGPSLNWFFFGLYNAAAFFIYWKLSSKTSLFFSLLRHIVTVLFVSGVGYFVYADLDPSFHKASIEALKNWSLESGLGLFILVSTVLILPTLTFDLCVEKISEQPLLMFSSQFRYIVYGAMLVLIMIFNRNPESFMYYKF